LIKNNVARKREDEGGRKENKKGEKELKIE
jgi:hypothetical protein